MTSSFFHSADHMANLPQTLVKLDMSHNFIQVTMQMPLSHQSSSVMTDFLHFCLA